MREPEPSSQYNIHDMGYTLPLMARAARLGLVFDHIEKFDGNGHLAGYFKTVPDSPVSRAKDACFGGEVISEDLHRFLGLALDPSIELEYIQKQFPEFGPY